jgi:hypothetical protein
MKTYANKGLATKALNKSGIVGARILQNDEGKFYIGVGEPVQESPAIEQESTQDAPAPVVDTSPSPAPVQDSPAPVAKSEQEMTDEEFARAMLAGGGRQSRKSATTEKKSAKTHPGMYVGERRNYPTRPGLCKQYWDFMTEEWANHQKSSDFALTAQEIRDICDAYNWTPSSFAAEYRYWRMYFGLPIRSRGAPSPAPLVQQSMPSIDVSPAPAPAPARKGKGKGKKAKIELDEVVSQSDVKITEV